MIRQRRRALRPVVDRLDDRVLLSGLSPQQVTQAYGLNAITYNANGQTVTADGSGQTIAVVVAYDDPYLASDLHTFDATFGLPDPSLSQVNLAGARASDGWAGEATMDVEWAHAMAPGANIVVVEARSDSFPDMVAAVSAARSLPGVSVVSMSWGMTESASQRNYDGLFTTPGGHTGITFVASSGDSGGISGADWPSSSPNVLAVGGTTLSLSAGGYGSEAAWGGSGGGISRYEAEPSYQANVQSSGGRTAPDVAFDGDPRTGVAVFTTTPSTGRGTWYTAGGTSLGAPAWAGIIAIIDQGRSLRGLGTLDGVTQTLPALYALPASDFHASGSVTTTGRGSPNGASLASDMVNASIGTTSPAQPQTAVGVAASAAAGKRRKAPRRRKRNAKAAVASTSASTSRPIQPAHLSLHDLALEALAEATA